MKNRGRTDVSRWVEVLAVLSLATFSGLATSPAGAAVPGEAQNLTWCAGTKDCLQWSATAGASQYRVYRGENASLNCVANAALDSCQDAIFAAATTGSGVVTEVPAPGHFYWFLVTTRLALGADWAMSVLLLAVNWIPSFLLLIIVDRYIGAIS